MSGAKLSVLHNGAKLSAVPNCQFLHCGAKLSIFTLRCQIFRCQIVCGAKLSAVPNCPIIHFQLARTPSKVRFFRGLADTQLFPKPSLSWEGGRELGRWEHTSYRAAAAAPPPPQAALVQHTLHTFFPRNKRGIMILLHTIRG